ncbi:MAG: DUF4238 domain-containing protein [Gemmatimonadaceae bacterium]|nr:DUF4238 domain-containing protein [Gemmatimonadaceae bacterium]
MADQPLKHQMGKHYVPQAYLRGFEIESSPGLIWMYDKRTQSWTDAPIKRVAQSASYYSDDVEQQLNALVEIPGNRALHALRGGTIPDPRTGGDLLTYIAVMMMRVPRKRTMARALVPSVIEHVLQQTRQDLESLRSNETDARVTELLAEVDRTGLVYRKEGINVLQANIEDPWPSEQTLHGVHSMCWRLVFSPTDSPLITCDSPAFYFSAWGIGSEESELTFPISPRMSLVGNRVGNPGEVSSVRVGRPIAKEINKRIAVGAERFIFAPFPFSWVAKLAKRTERELSRILW